jgi:hypothetical protein
MRITLFAAVLFAFFFAGNVCAEEKDISIEDFLQGLSTVPGVVMRRDPFIAASPPFEAPRPDGSSLSAPPLERYPVSSYSVVAVLIGEQYPRALLRLPAPEGSKVVIVKVGDKLGNKGGTITKMSKEGLTVVQNQRSPLGFVDKTEVKIPVGDKK